jgi:hypothetical protein
MDGSEHPFLAQFFAKGFYHSLMVHNEVVVMGLFDDNCVEDKQGASGLQREEQIAKEGVAFLIDKDNLYDILETS